jgi:glycosyltransferase involved in cell wall biosynthesis
MKVALFSKYPSMGASSRLRSLQFVPELARSGIHVTPFPLFDEPYLRQLYSGKGRSLNAVVALYATRVRNLRQAGQFDLVWLEKEALPYLPYFIERGVMPRGVPYVVDYDDAVFHNYDLSGRAMVRWLLGNKIDRVMAHATTVICGNDYLAERARNVGAQRIEQIPTVVDVTRYRAVPDAGYRQTVIGWIGSPSTQRYVQSLRPVFERLHREHSIRLVLVGAQPGMADTFGAVPVDVVPWSEETEVDQVARFDIGIMPLKDGPWERGKCGYKLIQYMACAKPFVASPVGVNVKIVNETASGRLADSEDEWFRSLEELLTNAGERRRVLGEQGRKAVEEVYSLQAQVPHLERILREAAGRAS